MEAKKALSACGGIAFTSQLVAMEVTKRSLRAAIVSGDVVRIRRGIYALSSIDGPLLAAARLDAHLAGTSALKHRGLWLMPDDEKTFEIWFDRKARLPSGIGRATVHRDRGWSGDDGFVVSVLHALLQLARRCTPGDPRSEESFLVAVESALNKELIVMDDLTLLAPRLPASLAPLLGFVVDSSQSGLETLARRRLDRIGIVARPQVAIVDVGVVDLLIGSSLILELDGVAHHDIAADRRRDLVSAARGLTTLRPDYRLVLDEWRLVESAVLAHVELGHHLH
ncbi:hypothetical protein HQQ80_08730 [Microbacteriaceae bacterium VKM Ac-2855]|nr:hypothetical protein [Microbacteriaceae bacterium VKM Ac-2855]